VILTVVMAAPSAPTIGTISTDTSRNITVPFTTVSAFPVVTRYDASCASTDGGTTVTGSATSSPITVASASPGKNYRCTVSAFNGSTGTSSSASNTVFVAGAPWNTSLPSFTGTAAYKTPTPEVLTGSNGTWDTPSGYAISGYTYLWQSQTGCAGTWSDAAGSTKNLIDYTIVAADTGNCLRLTVAATNSLGTSATVVSSSSQKVTSLPVFVAESPSTLGEKNVAFSYQFNATGERIAYSINWVGTAPTEPSFNTGTGLLSWTPVNDLGDFSYTITATNDSGSVTTSVKQLSISDGTAFSLEIVQQPLAAASGASLATQPSVRVVDEDGRVIITPMSIVATSTGALGGTRTLTTSAGTAAFSDLTLTGSVDTDYTLTFTSGSLSVTSAVTQVTPGALVALVLTTPPVVAGAAGLAMPTQPVVQLVDAQGNVIDDRSLTVTVSSVLSSNTSTLAGNLGGTTSLSTSTGVVTFTDLTFGGTVGTVYKLKFASGVLSVLSADVSNTQAGAATKLSIVSQPTISASTLVGGDFDQQPVVQILDADDNPTTSTAQVTATSSGGTLGGTTGVDAVAGTATFTGLNFAGLLTTPYTLTFTSPGLQSVTSSPFQFAAGRFGPVSRAVTTITTGATSLAADGTSTTSVTVRAKDAGGNHLLTSQGLVTLSVTSGVLSAVVDNNDGTYTATYTSPASRGTGTATVSGNIAGSPITATAVITLKTTQTIDFPQPANVPLGTLPYSMSATATSALAVTFTSSTSSVCLVTSAGMVSILSVGSCTIDADQAGDATHWTAPTMSRTFSVQPTTPSAPYISSVTPGSGWVDVAFVAPGFDGGATITDYEYSTDGGTNWVTLGSTSSPLRITPLTNGTDYVVRIRAVNSAGPGLSSADGPSVTPDVNGGAPIPVGAATPSAPRNGAVFVHTANDITLSWVEPESHGGSPVISYTVAMTPNGTCPVSTIASSARTASCSVNGLTPGTTYSFTIKAVNAVGPGASALVTYVVPGGGSGGGAGGGGTTSGGDDDGEDDDDDDRGNGDGVPRPGGPDAPPLPGIDDNDDGFPDPWRPNPDPNNRPGIPCSGCVQVFPAPSGGDGPQPGVTNSPPGSRPGFIKVSTGTGPVVTIGGSNPDGRPATVTSPNGGFVVGPGGNIPIVLTGLKPGSTVTVWLADQFSVSGVVGPDGTISLTATVPGDLPSGTYTGRVDLVDPSGQARSILFGFEWVGRNGMLPVTGNDGVEGLVIVLWMFVAGVLIIAVSRRRLLL
jgi:predicted RNA-binding protein with TRAM domain